MRIPRPLAPAFGLLLAAAPASAARTVVSLTFDDTFQTHALAGKLLEQRGWRGTFFVNAPRIGAGPTYMTLAQVQALALAGHEIGGHTLDHPDLTTLTPDRAREEICGDRARLTALGFDPPNFAYPFGAYDADLEALARSCGYSSARAIGGLSCSSCAAAGALPPPDPFAIETPDSLRQDTSLETMEKYVTDAEQAGGGWVPLVIHDICDGGCDLYTISSTTLSAFLDWLKARESSGTVVATVGEALGNAKKWTPPSPSVLSLVPKSASAGGPDFALAVQGTNFVPGASVLWNGSPRPTSFVDGAHLEADIPAADIAFATTALVSAANPGGGAGCAPVPFPVVDCPASCPSGPGPSSVESVRVYPNPWRADLHSGAFVTIDNLPPGSEVRIFTVTGRSVKTIDAPDGVGRWDLSNDSGARVSSGVYLYLITDGQGRREKGSVVIVR
jgi:peptidoglycan/xylan/chitin deacetylase (PgdA/CDA1 family)